MWRMLEALDCQEGLVSTSEAAILAYWKEHREGMLQIGRFAPDVAPDTSSRGITLATAASTEWYSMGL